MDAGNTDAGNTYAGNTGVAERGGNGYNGLRRCTPFRFLEATVQNIVGSIVTGPDFFPRPVLLDWIWERLPVSNILLTAPRRSGKTSIMWQLRDHPQSHYHGVYVNVEGASGAGQLVSLLFCALQEQPAFSSMTQGIRDWASRLLQREVKLETPAGTVELGGVLEKRWEDAGTLLLQRLDASTSLEKRLLLLVDELPILLERLRKKGEEGRLEALQLLHWFRLLRQSPASQQGRLRLMLSGSIGLEGVVSRLGESKAINDLEVIHMDPLSAQEAGQLVDALCGADAILADQAARQQLLDYIEQPYPYYIQLMFNQVKQQFRRQRRACTANDVSSVYTIEMLGSTGRVALSHMDERLDEALTPAEAERVRQTLDAVARKPRGLPHRELEKLLSGPVDGPPEGVAKGTGSHALRQLLLHDGYLKADQERYLFQTRLFRDFWIRHRGLSVRRTS